MQSPLHPVKSDPVVAAAASVTAEPSRKDASHTSPHEIPEGALTIEPAPVPAMATASDRFGVATSLRRP